MKNRFDKSDLNTLEFDTRLRTPHRLRGMTTSQEVIDLVCQIRGQDPVKSKYEIQAELKDLYDIKVGYDTIQKIINRHIHLLNTQHQKKLRKHRNHSIARIKAHKELRDKELGSLVQIDTTHLYMMGVRKSRDRIWRIFKEKVDGEEHQMPEEIIRKVNNPKFERIKVVFVPDRVTL